MLLLPVDLLDFVSELLSFLFLTLLPCQNAVLKNKNMYSPEDQLGLDFKINDNDCEIVCAFLLHDSLFYWELSLTKRDEASGSYKGCIVFLLQY